MTVTRSLLHHYASQLSGLAQAETTPSSPGLAWLRAQLRIRSGRASPDDILLYGSAQARADTLRERAAEEGAALMPQLRAFLNEGKPRKLAQEAFWLMLRLGDAAEPAAQEMFSSSNWTERKAATCLLRRWGKLTREQHATARNDSHIAVRFAADYNPRYGSNRKHAH